MLESEPQIKKEIDPEILNQISRIITDDERNLTRGSIEEAKADAIKINAELGEDLAFVTEDLGNIKIKFHVLHLGKGLKEIE